jgi:hypothetical protein
MYITSVQKNCGQAGRGFLSLLQTQVDFLVGVLWRFLQMYEYNPILSPFY